MVGVFQSELTEIVHKTFPEKTITISEFDQPFFTEKLRKLRRLSQREYCKRGKSQKYFQLKEDFEKLKADEIIKYKTKIIDEVATGKRGSIYPALKKLGIRPGSESESWFVLPTHQNLKLSPSESAELIATHFSKISEEFEPLKLENLSIAVQQYICTENADTKPVLQAHEVYNRIKKSKKPMSQVPGDLHPKLVKSFPELLVEPITKIFNKITSSSVYPCQWKEEHQVPIPKVEMPESEDDLRNIAKTAFFSKVYESFVADWLLNIIGPYFDPNQYGVKGLSTTHYLIKFLHFIQSQMDQKRPHAVLALYLDLSKAYNRVNHSLVIEDLYLMHTPAWLMKIVFSYLSQRSMVMNYMGAISNPRTINGGTPQGAFLGGIIFMIKFKGALLRPPIPRPLTESLSKSKSVTVKYVDDGSVAVSIDLKCSLKQDLQRERPLNFHERTHHYLPPSENLLQYHMQDAESFAKTKNYI